MVFLTNLLNYKRHITESDNGYVPYCFFCNAVFSQSTSKICTLIRFTLFSNYPEQGSKKSFVLLPYRFTLFSNSGVQLLKICYYEMPKNKEKLQNINRENHINNVDERKIFLRMKAGSLVYQLMTFVYLFVAFVLALLHIEAWIIGIIFGLFLLQTFLGIILYKHFEKHF